MDTRYSQMFGGQYLLLELQRAEADFYHLPVFVPYLKKHENNLKENGFEWNCAVEAMKLLIKEMDVDEYKLYKLFTKKWDYYKDLARSIQHEEWKEAERSIDKILSIDLLDPSAYLNLGFLFRKNGEFEKAKQAYIKGLELLPNNVPFLAGIARNYDEWGKKNDAIEAWKKVLDHSSENKEAYEMLTKYKIFRRVEEKDEETEELKTSYVLEEQFEEVMEKEYEKFKDDVEALTNLGVVLIKESCPKLAMKVFSRICELTEQTRIPQHLKVTV